MKRVLTDEQRGVVAAIIDRPFMALWADMGAGKTAIALHAAAFLLREGMIKKAVIVAPRAVADSTWAQEAALWPATSALKVVVLRGDARTRKTQAATRADVYCIGRDSLAEKGARRGCIASADLLALSKDFEKTLLIVDEASSIKNSQSGRFRALAFFRWGRVLELTGTPSPQGIEDIWPQIYLLDRGASLGKTITAFRKSFMRQRPYGHGFDALDGAQAEVMARVRHLVLRLEAPPPCEVRYDDRHVSLSRDELAAYAAFKRDMMAELHGVEITALNAGSLVSKLNAWASGGQYVDAQDGSERRVLRPHTRKRELLYNLFMLEKGPFLVFYWFNFSIDDIKYAALMAGKKFELFDTRRPQIVEEWNAGKIDVLAAHPQSAGMGLNLQHGGHKMIWLSIPWSSELWLQAVARLARRGQTNAVLVMRILCENTIDERISRVLGGKIDLQKLILDEAKI